MSLLSCSICKCLSNFRLLHQSLDLDWYTHTILTDNKIKSLRRRYLPPIRWLLKYSIYTYLVQTYLYPSPTVQQLATRLLFVHISLFSVHAQINDLCILLFLTRIGHIRRALRDQKREVVDLD